MNAYEQTSILDLLVAAKTVVNYSKIFTCNDPTFRAMTTNIEKMERLLVPALEEYKKLLRYKIEAEMKEKE